MRHRIVVGTACARVQYSDVGPERCDGDEGGEHDNDDCGNSDSAENDCEVAVEMTKMKAMTILMMRVLDWF